MVTELLYTSQGWRHARIDSSRNLIIQNNEPFNTERPLNVTLLQVISLHPHKIKHGGYKTFFAPLFQMRTPNYGSHSSLCLFAFVHTSLKKAPAAVVAMKDHLSFPAYPHPSLSAASDSLPCHQPEQGQTSSTPSLTPLCGRSKLCQAVLGAAGNVENAERNPEGADAAELQGCRIWARTLHVSLILTPQSVLVCDNGPRNRGQKALSLLHLAETLSTWISGMRKAEWTHPVHILQRPTSAHVAHLLPQ